MSKQNILKELKLHSAELGGSLFIHEGPTGILVAGKAPSETAVSRVREVVLAAAGTTPVDFRVSSESKSLVVVRDAPEENPSVTAKREKLHTRRKELAALEQLTETEADETFAVLTWLQEHPPLEVFKLDASQSFGATEPTGDAIRVFAQLFMAPGDLLERSTGKARSSSVSPRLDAAIAKGGFTAPIIVDTRLRIIDGRWRLLQALASGTEQVPVVILEATEKQATYLRLILNKSAEFQRWLWEEVDEFLEEHAEEYLAVLEPLGIFGERIIPQSFLGNTVLEYRIHDAEGMATQQQFYKQEHGLAKWAALAREEQEELVAEKIRVKQAKDAQKAPQTNSLFG